ncbi:hypothetical protein ABZV14_41755 [Streptosporangium canum]
MGEWTLGVEIAAARAMGLDVTFAGMGHALPGTSTTSRSRPTAFPRRRPG